MRTLRNDGTEVRDGYRLVEAIDALGTGDVVVPLALYREHAAQLANHAGSVGVCLENTDEPESLEADVLARPLIAIRFPAFNDGRGLSSAFLLRTRLGFTGDLRAVGDVRPDQLNYMVRCGFSSFALRDDDDLAEFADRLTVAGTHYQASVTSPAPLFRRRG